MKNSRNRLLIAACALLMLLVMCAVPILAEEMTAADGSVIEAETEATTDKETYVPKDTAEETYYDEYDKPLDTGYGDDEPVSTETCAPAETGADSDLGYTEPANYGHIHMQDANHPYAEGCSYSMPVYFNGTASTVFMELHFPYFVDVQHVSFSPLVMNADKVVTDFQTYGSTVRVSFSSAQEIGYGQLFSVHFTVNQRGNNFGTVDLGEYQFVNTNTEQVYIDYTPGNINITDDFSVIMGDVDRNGCVDLADVMAILRYKVTNGYLDSIAFEAADVNHDGTVDMIDAQYIQNFLVGRIGSLDNIYEGGNVPSDVYVKYVYHDEYGNKYVFQSNGEVLGAVKGKWKDSGDYIIFYLDNEEKWEFIIQEQAESGYGILSRVDNSTEACSHENFTVISDIPATCTESGRYVWNCNDCKTHFDEYREPTGHNYINGVCEACEDKYVEMDYLFNDESKGIVFYGDGSAEYFELDNESEDYVSMDDCGEWYWNDEGTIIWVRFDNLKLTYAFAFDGSGDDTMSLIEGLECGHTEIVIDLGAIQHPTCLEMGYVRITCDRDDCQTYGKFVISVNPEAHNYVEGICEYCKAEESKNDCEGEGTDDNYGENTTPPAVEEERKIFAIYSGSEYEYGTHYIFYADWTVEAEIVTLNNDGTYNYEYPIGKWDFEDDTKQVIVAALDNGTTVRFTYNADGALEYMK